MLDILNNYLLLTLTNFLVNIMNQVKFNKIKTDEPPYTIVYLPIDKLSIEYELLIK